MSINEELAEKCRDEIRRRLDGLVSVPSVLGEAQPDAPFGPGPKEALVKALGYLQEDGFRTVNLDNYAGYAEMGEGSEVIGIVAHLDVVPAEETDGWHSDPFTVTERDGRLYGRGVSDDKGAVVASMMALRILREKKVPLTKRVRLIMGTNEESGSKGLAYYVKKEGSVDYGFTPDGDFPLVYGEKGLISAVYRSKNTSIRSISGGTVTNIVCKTCTIEVDKCSFSRKALEDYFNNNNIPFAIEDTDNNGAKITVTGRAAHASTPELGRNAISCLMAGLHSAGFQDPFVQFYCDHFGMETDGKSAGVYCEDDYGSLTLNNGVIGMKDGVIEGTIDIRFPVTFTSAQVIRQWKDHMEDDNGVIEVKHTVEPLFYPTDSPLVSKLMEAYREATGDQDAQPLVIGGGTYAKEIDNTVAFGCAFPGRDYKIHNADEWVTMDELVRQTAIYVTALEKLLSI
jgi:succinyl-diaminopimelate desuccinylase